MIGKKFCNYWIHNGFITINDEKMSKSVQNFKTVRYTVAMIALNFVSLVYMYRQLVNDSLDARALRYFIVTSHYRNTLNFNNLSIPAAKSALQKIDLTICNLQSRIHIENRYDNEYDGQVLCDDEIVSRCVQDFETAMCDDLNTPRAIASFHELIAYANKRLQQTESKVDELNCILQGLHKMDKVFGIFYQPFSEEWPTKSIGDAQCMSYDEAVSFAKKRWELKLEKKFIQADEIRQKLIACGYRIVDKKNTFEVVPLKNL